MSSTLTQFLISYTIKTFGPVIFVLIATTRQLISVCISAALFGHDITALAWLAAILVFGTVIARSFRKHSEAGAKNSGTPEPEIARTSSTDAPVPAGPNTDGDNGAPEDSKVADPPVADLGETVGNPHDSGVRRASFHAKVFIQRLLQRDSTWKLLICILGMNLPLAVYSICQEFMATHTFGGELFKYPMFLIAMNRTAPSLVACVLLKMQGMRILDRGVWVTVFPAAVNLSATFCQYESLYFLRYPMQSLAKAVKVVPVMICGRLLKNRSYSLLDYGEALLVTGLVVLFMVLFHQGEVALNTHTGLAPGILLMAGYVVLDSFTSNIEDVIYQAKALDPAQMVLGMQAFAGVAAWFVLLVTGQLVPAITFLCRNSTALLPLFVLMFSEAIGCYACTLTVRLFGPAVFTLIMTSHQIISLLISVALFNHSIQHLTSALLVIVIVVVFTSTLRRVYAGEPAKTRGTEESRKQASKQA
jgi:adenosine 3'-phospho 5'-phosphosulfate transporter B2